MIKWDTRHLYKIPIVYFQSFTLPRGCVRYVHRCWIILRSTILIYALKEVIYVLVLKITHYKCLVFLWLVKNYGNDRIHQAFDEYLGRSVIWGISVVFYCALLKKKRTKDKKNSWLVLIETIEKFRGNIRDIYTCLTDFVYLLINIKLINESIIRV